MIKGLLVSVLTVVAVASLALAAPRIAIDASSYDFGQVVAGISVTHLFTLSNAGDEPLEISGVTPGCGCTTASLEKTTLGPGDSVVLRALVDTADFPGQQIAKTITVASNDPATPRLDLLVVGIVLPAADYQIAASELNRLYVLLIDVRSPDAYAASHFLGAMNVPYAQIDQWIARLPQALLIILYDQDGSLSDPAAQTLEEAGLPEARSLLGGLDRWASAYSDEYLTRTSESTASGLSSASSPLNYQVDVAELSRIFYVLVDIRSPEEYAAAHLMGALNLPYPDLAQWQGCLPQGVPLVLYDQTGALSDQAAQALRAAGFPGAQSLTGGLDEWTLLYGTRSVLAEEN